ncbi:hypothetical protein [Pseudomonas sp. DC3000-4b1]|uniref:hypothetical protein n=1 Tax=unclassified Pseudomonas TaxID=196821 RepID=UPI003CFA67D6
MSFSFLRRPHQWLAWLGLGCSLTALAQATSAPQQNPTKAIQSPPGTVILWNEHTDDGDNLKFNPSWGWGNQYSLKTADRPVQAGKVRYLRFVNIPSASTLVLSSGEFCEQSQDQDFWIELTSVRENATYPIGEGTASVLSISQLMSLGQDTIHSGFRVKASYRKPGASLDGLACVRMTTSRLPGQAVPTLPLTQLAGAWRSTTGTETSLCGDNAPAIIGRSFNFATHRYEHRCLNPALGLQGGPKVPERPPAQYADGYDICPAHTAVWSFTGTTGQNAPYYRLACRQVLDERQNPVRITAEPRWHGPFLEGDSRFSCPDDQLLIGRKSTSSEAFPEDAQTWYLCGTVQGYPSASAAKSASLAPTGQVHFVDDKGKDYNIGLGQFGSDQRYEFRNWGSPVPNDEIAKIALSGIPSATRIVLTDDELCRPDQGNYAITLTSWKEGASLPLVNLLDLGANDLGFPVGQGLRLNALRGNPTRGTLSCMRVQLSRLPGEPAFDTPLPLTDRVLRPGADKATCAEGALSAFVNRAGAYEYQCAKTAELQMKNSETLKGSTGGWVMCPHGKVLMGARKDAYECAEPRLGEAPLAVEPEDDWRSESGGSASCPDGKVIAGLRPTSTPLPSHVRCATVKQ